MTAIRITLCGNNKGYCYAVVTGYTNIGNNTTNHKAFITVTVILEQKQEEKKKGTSMLSVCISGQANEAENVKVTGNDGQVQRLLRPVGQ